MGKQALDLGKQKVKEYGQKAVKEFQNKLNKTPAAGVAQEIFKKPAKRKHVVLPAPVLKRPAPVLSKHAPEPVVNRPETEPLPAIATGRRCRRKSSRRSTVRRA